MSFGDELRGKMSTAPVAATEQEAYAAYLQYLRGALKEAIRRDTDEKLNKLPAGSRLSDISGDLPYYMKWQWYLGDERYIRAPRNSVLYRYGDSYDGDPPSIIYPALIDRSSRMWGGMRVGLTPEGRRFVSDLAREARKDGILLTTRIEVTDAYPTVDGKKPKHPKYVLKGTGMEMENVPSAAIGSERYTMVKLIWQYKVI